MTVMPAGEVWRFGPFTLDRRAYRLTRGDAQVPLAPKAFDLLLLLVSRRAELVTKDDILAALWPDVAVTDNAITQVVSELRRALGDAPAAPSFVETVPRKGYRFVAEITGPASQPGAGPGGTRTGRRPGEGGGAGDGVRTVGVLDFANVSHDEEVAWLARGLAETVSTDLRAMRGLRVVDRALLSFGADAMDAEAARAAGLDLVVVGSVQRAGSRVRIGARAIDVASGEAVVHARADGEIAGIFALQDAIVQQLVSGLRLTVLPGAAGRARVPETSSLDAYRALTEGRLKLEALDPSEIPGAIASFERALESDPDYALAHCGLAHARFWRFQAARARVLRPTADLERAIAHAERAIALDPDLAEAHATLAFILAAAGRGAEAVASGRRAVTLEPGNWRHEFRLGIAAWGGERLEHLGSATLQFPRLAYGHFAMAMVFVARGDLAAARGTLERGIASYAEAPGQARFPSRGLHWLLGLVHLARQDVDAARRAFDAERHSSGSRLFAEEYIVGACEGLGMIKMADGDAAGAADLFEQGLEWLPDHPASAFGLATACRALGAAGRAAEAEARGRRAAEALEAAGRRADAAMARAAAEVVAGRIDAALAGLRDLLDHDPPGHAGWSIPVDPLLGPVRSAVGYRGLASRLASRAV